MRIQSVTNISEAFQAYEVEAFRLETLPVYNVPQEQEPFQKFKSGMPFYPSDTLLKYIANAKEKILEGKRHIRTRVIPSPVTDYFIFECLLGYLSQSKVGFEFAFIDHSTYASIVEKYHFENYDFWLFDKLILFKMIYNSDGSFKESELVTDSMEVERCIKVRNEIVSIGKTLSYVIDQYKIKIPKSVADKV